MNPTELSADLANFTGSETFTRWSILFRNSVLTEGAKYLADQAGAYWLMDAIASWQHDKAVKNEDFQVWWFGKRNPNAKGWDLVGEDGNYGEIAHQRIGYSDFPLSEIKLFACRNELGGITIMLPGEY